MKSCAENRILWIVPPPCFESISLCQGAVFQKIVHESVPVAGTCNFWRIWVDPRCWLDLLSRQDQNTEVFQPLTCSFHPKMLNYPKCWMGIREMRFECPPSVSSSSSRKQQWVCSNCICWGGGERKTQIPSRVSHVSSKKSRPCWVLHTGVTGRQKQSPERGEVQLWRLCVPGALWDTSCALAPAHGSPGLLGATWAPILAVLRTPGLAKPRLQGFFLFVFSSVSA